MSEPNRLCRRFWAVSFGSIEEHVAESPFPLTVVRAKLLATVPGRQAGCRTVRVVFVVFLFVP